MTTFKTTQHNVPEDGQLSHLPPWQSVISYMNTLTDSSHNNNMAYGAISHMVNSVHLMSVF
jgi:hypothetical protein